VDLCKPFETGDAVNLLCIKGCQFFVRVVYNGNLFQNSSLKATLYCAPSSSTRQVRIVSCTYFYNCYVNRNPLGSVAAFLFSFECFGANLFF